VGATKRIDSSKAARRKASALRAASPLIESWSAGEHVRGEVRRALMAAVRPGSIPLPCFLHPCRRRSFMAACLSFFAMRFASASVVCALTGCCGCAGMRYPLSKGPY
jgi:hypothetical protein